MRARAGALSGFDLDGRDQGYDVPVRERLSGERGQTAAEYMGVLVLGALVIVALTTLGIGDQIAERIRSAVETLSQGGGSGLR